MRSELFEEAWKQNRHVWESTKCIAQAMYLAGEQHQQSKVDELQLKLSEDSRILHNVIDIERKKNDELQKRVDAALRETKSALQYVEGDMRGNHEFLKMAMIRTFKVLEQALKGGEE